MNPWNTPCLAWMLALKILLPNCKNSLVKSSWALSLNLQMYNILNSRDNVLLSNYSKLWKWTHHDFYLKVHLRHIWRQKTKKPKNASYVIILPVWQMNMPQNFTNAFFVHTGDLYLKDFNYNIIYPLLYSCGTLPLKP